MTNVPTCCYSLSGFPKVVSSARMRVDVCEGSSSRPPFWSAPHLTFETSPGRRRRPISRGPSSVAGNVRRGSSLATVLSEELERVAGVLVRQAHPHLSAQEIKEAAGRTGHRVGRLNAVAGKINSLADNASKLIFDEVAKRRPRAIEVSSDHCIVPCIHTLTRPALPTPGVSSTSITR